LASAKPTTTVRLFTALRILAGVRETQVEASNIQELIEILVTRFGEKFSQMLLEEDGSLKRYFHVLVNGRHIRLINGTQTTLEDGDIVAIFPPLGGGSQVKASNLSWFGLLLFSFCLLYGLNCFG
jgi:molybdopterin synthase sulfur carrier subunit